MTTTELIKQEYQKLLDEKTLWIDAVKTLTEKFEVGEKYITVILSGVERYGKCRDCKCITLNKHYCDNCNTEEKKAERQNISVQKSRENTKKPERTGLSILSFSIKRNGVYTHY